MGETSCPCRNNIHYTFRDELQKDKTADRDTDTISVSGDVKLTDNMALRPRSPGDAEKNYVSTVSNDEFHEFQQNGYHDEEDIDFTPQNGYLGPEDEAPMPSKGKKIRSSQSRSDGKDCCGWFCHQERPASI